MIAQVLQKAGYDTYLIGKWDDGDHYPYSPLDRGYNESLHFALGASMYNRDYHPDLVNVYEGTE